MKTFVSALLLLLSTIIYAQSDKDMIIASWKCVSIEQVPTQATSKKHKPAPKVEAPNIDSLRKDYLGVVYGFRNNGTVIFNKDGSYKAYQHRVEGNVLTIMAEDKKNTVYTIQHLDYRTMAWQDTSGLVYKFERE